MAPVPASQYFKLDDEAVDTGIPGCVVKLLCNKCTSGIDVQPYTLGKYNVNAQNSCEKQLAGDDSLQNFSRGPSVCMLWETIAFLVALNQCILFSRSMSSMLARRRVAVIGAGPAGLVTSKQLADCGITAKVFANNVGGMWNSHKNPFWPNMKTNLSKFTCRFSDHPWPEHAPVFPNQQDMHSYLNEYAGKHIHPDNIVTDCKVTALRREDQGQYRLTWESAIQSSTTELFDDVVIASGFFSKPVIPGEWKEFAGRVIHSSEYTSPESFSGRRVAVVGASFSSAEIAADVATTASAVYNVLPRPAWMIPRYLPIQPDKPNTAFLPVDLLFYQLRRQQDGESRSEVLFKQDADRAKTNAYMQALLGGDAEDVLRELRAAEAASHPASVEYTVPSVHASISDNYAQSVRAGFIQPVCGYVRSGTGSTLHVTPVNAKPDSATAAERIEDIDDVILCTGFTPALEYLDGALRETIGFSHQDTLQPLLLHRDVAHPDLPGLYCVGMYRGPYFAVLELQARAVAGYISGKLAVPSVDAMRRGVELSRRIREQQPRPQFPHADYVGLCYDWMRELGIPRPFSEERAEASTGAEDKVVFSPALIAAERDAAQARRDQAELASALSEFNAGKHLSQTIFRALSGMWEFQRTLTSRLDIAPSGTVVGTIALKPHSRGCSDLVYEEKGRFTTTKGMVMDVNGSQYVYVLNEAEDCIDVYFADKATGRVRERIFVSLKVVRQDEDGWVAVGEPHLCGEDTYRVQFKLAFRGLALQSVLVGIDVIGPYKDYTSVTLLQRPTA